MSDPGRSAREPGPREPAAQMFATGESGADDYSPDDYSPDDHSSGDFSSRDSSSGGFLLGEQLEAGPVVSAPVGPSRWSGFAMLGRALGRRGGALGAVMLATVVAFALLGPLFSPWELGQQDFDHLAVPPLTGGHVLGTDVGGFDVYTMLVTGTGRSLLVAAIVGLCAPLLGALYGATIGLWGGRRERAGLWLLDMLMLMPAFLLVAVVMSAGGGQPQWWAGSAWTLAALLTLVGWMPVARLVRAQTRSLREREFVRAARYLGLSHAQIVRRHVLPQVSSYIVLAVVTGASLAIITETLLSYLSIGVRPPDVSLGQLIGRSTGQLYAFPWLFWAPTAVLVWITLGLALLGDAVRDALDPKGRR